MNANIFTIAAFKDLAKAYREQVKALIQGGVDILLIETIFDTLNCKAAIYAMNKEFDAIGKRLPIWVSSVKIRQC